MTIASTTARTDYDGSGSAGPFYVTFPVYAQADVTVISEDSSGVETTLALNTDYTWTSFVADNLGQVTAGQITLTSALASGYHLSILLEPAGTQLTDIKNQANFFPVTHESEMDKLAQKDLQQQELLDKGIIAPDSEPAGTAILRLPSIANRAGLFLGFDSGGNVALSNPLTGSFVYSPWVPFTGTGAWTNSTYLGFWRRVGDTIEVMQEVLVGGAVGDSNLALDMPNGLSVDLAKMTPFPGLTYNPVGEAIISDPGTGYTYVSTLVLFQAGPVGAFLVRNGNPTSLVYKLFPFTIAPSTRVNLKYRVPVSGWS